MKEKELIVQAFNNYTLSYDDSIPMDEGIKEFIYSLNKSSSIKTTNSCAGHDKFESNAKYDFVSHPYLAFLVNEKGWDVFWSEVLPRLCGEVLVHIHIITEYQKTSICIRCHYEDKKAFWENVKPLFHKYF